MLWVLGQVHRRHFLAKFRSLTQCNFIYLPLAIVRPVYLALPLSGAAAALTARQNSNVTGRPALSLKDANVDHTTSTKRKRSGGDQETRQRAKVNTVWARLPPDLPSVLDTLSTRNMTGDVALTYLHGIRGSDTLLYHLQHRDRARMLAENLSGTQSPRRGLRTLIVAHNLGTVFKQNAYECVVHQLAKGDHWDLVLSAIRVGRRHTGRTTPRLLNWRARALIETSQFGLLDDVPKEFECEGLQPNRRTFHLLLSGHIRNRDLEKARNYLSKMKEADFPADASTHALIVSVYRSLGPDVAVQQNAFNVLGELGGREATVVLNSLIQFALDDDNLTSALRYLALFSVSPDAIGQSENLSVGDHDISVPIRHTTLPDPATFTILINHISKERDLPRLSYILQKMFSFGVKPDNILIAAVIRALCTADDAVDAVCMVARMCDEEKTPIALFHRLGLNSQTTSLAIPPISSGLSPDIHVFNALIKGMSNTLGINGIRVVLRIMHANGVLPDSTTFEILATYLNKHESPQPRTLIRTVRSLLPRSSRPSLTHMHAILKAVIRQEKVWIRNGTVSGHLDDVAVDREQPRHFDPMAGIDIPKKLSYRSMTRSMTRSLTSRCIRSDRVTIALRMKQAAARQDLNGVEAAFRVMLKRGMHPNAYHYASLMHAHANAGNMAMAENIFQSAIREGVKPNATMFTILIVGHGRQGKPRSAMRAFEDMVSRGIEPDKPSIHAVANAYYTSGLHGTARRVLVDLWSSLAPLPEELRNTPPRQLLRAFHTVSTDDQQPRVPLSRRRQRMLRWKLRRLIQVCKLSLRPSGTPGRIGGNKKDQLN